MARQPSEVLIAQSRFFFKVSKNEHLHGKNIPLNRTSGASTQLSRNTRNKSNSNNKI